MRNKHGLPRDIPPSIKQQVRQNCRFGCVLCRAAVCDYEHIDPPFAEATEHAPERICLLCPSCHADVTRGRVSKREVASRYEEIRRNGTAEPPRDDAFFRVLDGRTELIFGRNHFAAVDTLIEVDGHRILAYREHAGCPPFVLSGRFTDGRGAELFRIDDNEWVGPLDAFDVEQRGPSITIRQGPERVLFAAVKEAASGRVVIRVLDMLVPPFHILTLGDALHIGRCSPDLSEAIYTALFNWSVMGGAAGISLNSKDLGSGIGSITIDDRGYRLEGTGITIAPGGASMAIGGFEVTVEGRGGSGTAPERYRHRLEAAAK